MGSIRTAGAAAVLTAGLLLQQGCAARKPAPRPPAQPSLGASQLLRTELMRADPNARIGFVTQVLADAQLVAVRDVPVDDFARGDTVNFLDGNGQPLTTGTVERVLNGAEVSPGPKIQTDAEVDNWIRNVAATANHPASTCMMGIGPKAVVDPQFRVNGVERLRVVDASAMPDLVSAHINACVLMMAEKASDLIRGKPAMAAAA